MPVVRGSFYPEVEGTGMVKRYFDVLLWSHDWSLTNLSDLNDVQVHRRYLQGLVPPVCDIRLLVPSGHTRTYGALTALDIQFASVQASLPSKETRELAPDEEAATAVETALAYDADVLIATNPDWFPWINDFERLGFLLTDTRFLKFQCDIFSRGNDVPWASGSKTFGLTWTGFYHMTETETFGSGMKLLHLARQKGATKTAFEIGRTLIYNRLPNICFTRDRLLYYEIQRLASLRAKWKRQRFAFETAYYLNFYYPLIYGGFDHVALLVSECLQLGLPAKNVGATYKSFLDPLKAKNAALHGVFTDAKHTDFIMQIGLLRHYAAHRGSLMPTQILEQPDKEPTDDELDADIAAAGLDATLLLYPPGQLRDSWLEILRYNAKMAHYEKGKVIDGVIPVEQDGKLLGFIQPRNDTDFNFQHFMLFLDQVLSELAKVF